MSEPVKTVTPVKSVPPVATKPVTVVVDPSIKTAIRKPISFEGVAPAPTAGPDRFPPIK